MKKLLSFALIIVVVVSLFGCHGKQESSAFELPEKFDSEKEYEITFWAKNDTNITQAEIYKKAIADFSKYYPNITVNMRLYNDYGKIYQDVITNISTKTTPNVCITYPDHIATYLTGSDTVVPLDELMNHPSYGLGGSDVLFDAPKRDELIPKFLEECLVGGKQYALPYMRSTEACYVNKTYVEKLGFELPETLTWDFIWEVSEAAMEKDENGNFLVNGQKVLIPVIYKSTDNMMIQMLAQKNGDYSNERGDIKIFNPTTTSLLEMVYERSKSGEFNTFKLIGYPANYLNAGQCIFAIDSTAGATWMGCDAPLIDIAEEKLIKFETKVMTVPQFSSDDPKMISQGPSMCIFNHDDPQEVVASWLFCQYMLTNEVQIAYSQTEGYVPVTTKAQNSSEFLDYLSREGEDNDFYYDVKIKAVKLLMENTDKTFVTPVFNGSASLRNAAGQLVENINKAARRSQAFDDALINSIYADVTSLYRLDQIDSNANISTLGPLPSESLFLLVIVGVCWLLMVIYVGLNKINKKNT